MDKYYFTSESVTEGHPDKMCDYIADRILDECLIQDRESRVAVEVFASKDKITVAGQITSNAKFNIDEITRNSIKEIGYDNSSIDIDYRTCNIDINITRQSSDIAKGVDLGGAGDQGIMFGYATVETGVFMPYAILMAHKLANRLTEVRKNEIIKYLRPDGKTQIVVEYENGIPKRIENILVSTQHLEKIDLNVLRKDIMSEVIKKVIPEHMIDKNTKILINPNGQFVIGGPLADTGLTGRKIIVDTYGGYARHGGGAFSGKDATKLDRSAAYMARHIAKNIVANEYAKKCEIQLSYAIGINKPLSIYVNTFGTGNSNEDKLLRLIKNKFDLTPKGIVEYLKLKEPIYSSTTNYGHFCKEYLPWEKLIKI